MKFVAWVLKQAWKYGASKVAKAASWAKNNWRTVLKWLDRGIAYGTILHWILQHLGLA
ncbi:aureocin A53 family class IId bacteriocin [Tersicoccus sp. Bi-70]|uniref:aureocin A53 family class IId bacteriocin n=1 Tax=Tersicoccus sp. Bi-70 TaxID=1897634 RepID=UPI0018E9D20B|nr:aureocin A53 family class IId bacteriocin [Tersicoccus sp. Bi-70]